jgi:DNA polymerase-3 subunit delta'
LSWQSVKGHDELVAAFARAVGRGRLAHAYLFTGPTGIGKRLFAVELAKTLLCESLPAERFEACDRCASCNLVDAGTHPDLFAISRPEDKQDLPIEVVRRLCDDLSMKPARGKRKVAIVDDADDLNDQSANCFLKTLEEPPPGSLLILVGTSPDRQLPTIRSRCQVIPFAPLPEAAVRDLLRGEGGIDAAMADRLAKLGDGSPGLARDLADAGLWKFRDTLFRTLVRSNPDGPAVARAFVELVEGVGKDSGAQRRRAALIIRLLVDGLRQALAVGAGDDSPDAGVLGELATKLGPDGLLARIDRCLEADVQVDRKVQTVLVVEALVDALVYPAA